MLKSIRHLSKTLTASLIIAFSLTSSAFSADGVDKTSQNLTPPAWDLKTQSGENISSKDFQGQPVILHFWATWCPYCKKLQPKLVELQQKYKDQDVKIVAISFNEDDGAMPQDEIKSRGYEFITAVNGDDVAAKYAVKGTPTTFFINKSNQVIFKSTSSNIEDPRLELATKEIIK